MYFIHALELLLDEIAEAVKQLTMVSLQVYNKAWMLKCWVSQIVYIVSCFSQTIYTVILIRNTFVHVEIIVQAK